MPDRWQVRVDRLPRYGLPLVTVRLSDLLRVQLVVSPADATTSFAHHVADYLHGPTRGRGRRIILSDTGPTVARIVRLQQFDLQLVGNEWLELGPLVVAIAARPEAIGVGGMLGLDILARFSRVSVEIGPPNTLILERDT